MDANFRTKKYLCTGTSLTFAIPFQFGQMYLSSDSQASGSVLNTASASHRVWTDQFTEKSLTEDCGRVLQGLCSNELLYCKLKQHRFNSEPNIYWCSRVQANEPVETFPKLKRETLSISW